jgi:hypothetical protein
MAPASTELQELRARSAELAGSLDDDEALQVNAAILDLDPGDPVATNRLGIGLLRTGAAAEAVRVLEAGLRLHPDDAIMQRRFAEATKRAAAPPAAPRRPAGSARRPGAPVGGWTDFEPADLVEGALAGAGRDACIRLCADAIRASERIDAERTAVTPIKTGRRFRVIGGIFTGVGPWRDTLTVSVPTARRAVVRAVEEAGGRTLDEANAIPSVQLALPRPAVEGLYDLLLEAHVEHLRASLAAGPPTHLAKHSPAVRRYLLEQADALAGPG